MTTGSTTSWSPPPSADTEITLPKIRDGQENRKAPMGRLIQKLGLGQFRNVGPLDTTLLDAAKVGIRLKQHLGAPCEPVVGVGDHVTKGQVVGRRPTANGQPALAAPVHASIDGTVTDIRDGVIWIERK